MNSIIVGLTNWGKSPFFGFFPEIKYKLLILNVIACEFVTKSLMFRENEFFSCFLLKLVLQSVLESSEFLYCLAQCGFCLLVSLFMFAGRFRIIFSLLLFEFLDFLFADLVQIFQLKSQQSLLTAFKDFVNLSGVGEIAFWNHLHVKLLVVFDKFLLFRSQLVRSVFQNHWSTRHQALITPMLSSWGLFVIQFLSKQCNLNFRRSQQKLSKLWVLWFRDSNLPNMINSDTSFLFQELNQKFILPLNLVRRSVNCIDDLFISQSFKFIFGRNSLVKLIENIGKLFLNVVYHFVSIFNWLLSTFFGLLAEVFFLDDFLENSFVIWEFIIDLIIFSLQSGSYSLKFILIFLQLSFSSQNLQSWFIFNLLLINC